jgi:hypothetical protein
MEDIDHCKWAIGKISTVATNVAGACLERLVCVGVRESAFADFAITYKERQTAPNRV